MLPWIILNKRNVELVSLKTGRSMEELEAILEEYSLANIFNVRIPLSIEKVEVTLWP